MHSFGARWLHQPLPFLHETLLFLILAGILIPLLQRLRINQVLGFFSGHGHGGGPQWLGAVGERMASACC